MITASGERVPVEPSCSRKGSDPLAFNKAFNVGVIESHLASEGFLALIGWDILSHCILTSDGPAKRFSLEF